MWSLYNKKESDSFLENFEGEKLEPLKFSNGKTQADIVKEILDAISLGNKIIFIRGVCGSGKSAVALNLARHFKKTSIVVPIKSLQEQYEHDYTKKKFILKEDRKKLKISIIKGRNNFPCKFMKDMMKSDDSSLPCTIEIKESNMEKIKDYLSMNKSVSRYDFSSLKDIRRFTIAPICPYWSPLFPSDINSKALEDAEKIRYKSVSGKEYAIFRRMPGCRYYQQYESYIDSDVLIFNSLKYLIETAIGRKPRTDLDIIDECDEFLDNFAQEETINLSRLSFALSSIFPDNQEQRESLRAINEKVNSLLFDYNQDEIEKLNHTEVIELIDLILDNPDLAEEDEDSYYNKVYETVSTFSPFLQETYVSFSKERKESRETAYITLVTINLAARFKEISNSCSALVLMSGTLHSEQVLKDIFGIENFKIIEAETIPPGTIMKARTGLEKNCSYDSFKRGIATRENYLKALSSCVKNAKPPVLIHVNSFEDLPNELEKAQYKLDNLITKEKLKTMQSIKDIDKFKSGEINILFTTKCSRGIDFPGDKCNSIILTRYPYPNIRSPFWQILKKEQPDKFNEFYWDKAKRELLQKIYRGLRFKEDHIILLSPDIRVLNDSLK